MVGWITAKITGTTLILQCKPVPILSARQPYKVVYGIP